MLQDSAVDSADANSDNSGQGQVVQYYDQLAARYDRDRFGNSYGAYLDVQERRLLGRWLAPIR